MCVRLLRTWLRAENNRKAVYVALFWMLLEFVLFPVIINAFSWDHDLIVSNCFYDYQQQHWDNGTASWQWVCRICVPLLTALPQAASLGIGADVSVCQNFTGVKEYCQTPEYCQFVSPLASDVTQSRIYRYPTDQASYDVDSGLINLWASAMFLMFVVAVLFFLIFTLKIRTVGQTKHGHGFVGKFGFLAYMLLTCFVFFVVVLICLTQHRSWGAAFGTICLMPLPLIFWARFVPYDAARYPSAPTFVESEYDTHMSDVLRPSTPPPHKQQRGSESSPARSVLEASGVLRKQ